MVLGNLFALAGATVLGGFGYYKLTSFEKEIQVRNKNERTLTLQEHDPTKVTSSGISYLRYFVGDHKDDVYEVNNVNVSTDGIKRNTESYTNMSVGRTYTVRGFGLSVPKIGIYPIITSSEEKKW